MDVVDEDFQIVPAHHGLALSSSPPGIRGCLGFHQDRAIPPPKHVTPQPMAGVEATGVAVLKPAHPLHEIALGRFNHRVIMVVHQHSGVDSPPGALAGLAQRLDKQLAVLVVNDNRFPPIAPGHHVVDRSRILDARLAGHGGALKESARLSRVVD